jgi:hypothetical protein
LIVEEVRHHLFTAVLARVELPLGRLDVTFDQRSVAPSPQEPSMPWVVFRPTTVPMRATVLTGRESGDILIAVVDGLTGIPLAGKC